MVKLPSFSRRRSLLVNPSQDQGKTSATETSDTKFAVQSTDNLADSVLDNMRSEMPDYGRIEAFDGLHMSGWYFNIEQKSRSLNVMLDDQILCGTIANLPRDDVAEIVNSKAAKFSGFFIDLHEYNILKKCENLQGLYDRLKVVTTTGRNLAHDYDDPYQIQRRSTPTKRPISHFDGVEAGIVNGWIVTPNSSFSSIVHIFVDGVFQGAAKPNSYRKDVGDLYGDYSAGFTFFLSPRFQDGEIHEVTCRVAETGEHLLGSPKDILLPSAVAAENSKMRALIDQYSALRGQISLIEDGIRNLAFSGGAFLVNYPFYQEIIKASAPTLATLSKHSADAAGPFVSIVMPTYRSDLLVLGKAIDSVVAQTDPAWELIISDSASRPGELADYLKQRAAKDPRIKLIFNSEVLGISENTNVALKAAIGEIVGFMDHDDELAPEAVALNKAAFKTGDYDIVYSDEDKINSQGDFVDPHYKPAFDLDLLLSMNYICHLLFVRTSVLMQTGLLRKQYDGAQDWDLLLQLLKIVNPRRIGHIPRVLYHWRMVPGSTALAIQEKSYAVDAGLSAVQEYLATSGFGAAARRSKGVPYVDVIWEAPQDVLISVIIPTKDRIDLVTNCINSFQKTAGAARYEILIVDNNSSHSTSIAFAALTKNDSRIRVLRFGGAFNYSAINNFAAKQASGEFILLLNNDVFFSEVGWLQEMIGVAARGQVGVVGLKLLYPDNTIQHCGVVLGNGGVAGHAFSHLASSEHGYFARATCNHQVSAVTAACLLVRAATYRQVGGLDEDGLTVAFNDVDFCMKVQSKRLNNVLICTSFAYHAESISRGHEDSLEKITRFQGEINTMKERWGDELYHDRFYSPNFDLSHECYSQIDLASIAKQERKILTEAIVR